MMIKPTRIQWLSIATIAALVGVGTLAWTVSRVQSGEPLFLDYGAECKKQGPGSHVFIMKRDDGTQKTSILSCDGRGEFRSLEPR